ncbi:hypothetical protein R69888_00705 [Paraburkholderia haematera]|uniref:Uncharacterized protein n=1 Tax=Paraburkholderia haematera TaxID=2793077 RepID=A0ABN7KMD1_9BURK|nr:hypothetical protein R69888_00705 [Paraburkholderia haematera]
MQSDQIRQSLRFCWSGPRRVFYVLPLTRLRVYAGCQQLLFSGKPVLEAPPFLTCSSDKKKQSSAVVLL